MSDPASSVPKTSPQQARVLTGDRTLMRIIISADDRYHGRATSQTIVELLRTRGFAGATVITGIMGFGARRHLHSEMNEITSLGLPVVIEVVEEEARIAAVLPDIDVMIKGGVITLERAAVRLYRGDERRVNGLADSPSGSPPA